tara:strand:+ start:309 stop:578 length:270 start_codon:yes stop_codon:yes gene_type:complete
MDEKENKRCALQLNALIYELQEKGHTDNAIANGILFALSIHIINSRFSVNEIIEQLIKLHKSIKEEIGKIDDTESIRLSDSTPINSMWD